MKFLAKIASVGVALFFTAHVMAHPIATAGTEGLSVIASGGEVIAKYEGNSASYSNDLLLNLTLIFNNQASAVGDIANLGNFAAGTELVFQLHVNNTGDNWYTGLASRNADGLFHARVQENWQPGVTLVSFEDLWGNPEGDQGFNDLSFSFTNTKSGTSVPESSAFILMMIGFGLLGFARRKNV